MHVARRVAIVLGGILFVVLALIGLLSQVRGTPLRAVQPAGTAEPLPAVGDSSFARTMELFVGAALEPGNRVDILSNGDETYPRLWADLRAARRTITAQNYYSMPGAVADTFGRIMAERARAGVRVLVLFDAFGSQPLLEQKGWVDTLESAGVKVRRLRPLRWQSLQKAAQRSHARAFVVDGVVGYTGGFGLADYWLGNGRREGEWREANVRFEGQAVTQLQAAFASSWAEATGELLVSDAYFPARAFQNNATVSAALLHTMPTTGSTPAERFLALTISGARRTLYISNSYFVPDDDLRRMLMQAVRRGTDVRVLTAGEKTDVRTTWYAGRRFYDELLAGGVRIYEYVPSMMHSKSIVADGLWLTVGSMNFDNRSIAFNNETNLIALDAATGATMDSIFLADLRYSREIKLTEWRQRGWWRRPLEAGAALLSRIL
jgi:cardiolipin synthase